MTRLELLTMLYSLQILLDKELYDEAKELLAKVIQQAEYERKVRREKSEEE